MGSEGAVFNKIRSTVLSTENWLNNEVKTMRDWYMEDVGRTKRDLLDALEA